MSTPKNVFLQSARRLLVGPPKRTDQETHERLGIIAGLAVFTADAISSVAYAGEEVLLVLMTAGAAASAYALPISLAIVALLFIVAASYAQTIRAYPNGGGSYVVSKDNLGTTAGLTAGAALLVDYVLTVAVSTASGVAAITSSFPSLQGHEVALGLAAVVFVAWINLRGLRESGAVFAVPTYSFIAGMLVMLAVGVYRAATGGWHPIISPAAGFGFGSATFRQLTSGVTAFLLLRAFASGCTALSGIEAVSNGVKAFKQPEPDTAIRTMNLGRTILYLMFGGIALLSFGFNILPNQSETVLSQLGHAIFGGGPLYYYLQFTTALILFLAANTAYAGFPSLTSFIARDGFLPRRLANRGDTLVYNGGIVLLAALASALIVIFRGSVHLLIPLYAVGVFLAFTMSQIGMVVHWLKQARATGKFETWSILVNGLGACLSGLALVIITITKFASGAWIVTIIIPLMISYFTYVAHYYRRFKGRVESLQTEHMTLDDAQNVKVVLTIGGLSPVIDHSFRVARKLSSDITAVYVAVEPAEGERIRRKWDIARHDGVPLTVLESPYRDVTGPLRTFLDRLLVDSPGTLINLLVPVIITNQSNDEYLHNGTADQIVRDLRYSEGILITVIPFFVNMTPDAKTVIVRDRSKEPVRAGADS